MECDLNKATGNPYTRYGHRGDIIGTALAILIECAMWYFLARKPGAMEDSKHVTRATAWFGSVIIVNFALNYLLTKGMRMQPERAMVMSGTISSLLIVPGMLTFVRARRSQMQTTAIAGHE